MLGKPMTAFITPEDSAEKVAQAIVESLEMPAGEKRDQAIYRNAKHLQLVLPTLSLSAEKQKEYEKLVADNLIE